MNYGNSIYYKNIFSKHLFFRISRFIRNILIFGLFLFYIVWGHTLGSLYLGVSTKPSAKPFAKPSVKPSAKPQTIHALRHIPPRNVGAPL